MLRFLKYVFLFVVMFLFACSPNKQEDENKQHEFPSVKCKLKVLVTGDVDHVSFCMFQKSEDNTVNIDQELNLSLDSNEVFDINVISGSELTVEIKTSDSYGAPVVVKVFVNDLLWIQESDSYQIHLDQIIPNPEELK